MARLELDFVSAAEAEKSSVLAITDEESERFADQARAATAQLESERQELGSLLATDQFARERDLSLSSPRPSAISGASTRKS